MYFQNGLVEFICNNVCYVQTNGFFIECGANDGEFFSSTLDLEMRQNWSGLLVEANPPFAEKLLKRHRKAWFSDIALAPNNEISEVKLT